MLLAASRLTWQKQTSCWLVDNVASGFCHPSRYVAPRMTQIYWNAERKVTKWGTETADRFVPAVLRLTATLRLSSRSCASPSEPYS